MTGLAISCWQINFFCVDSLLILVLIMSLPKKRKKDFHFEFRMAKSCITTIKLPPGFDVESLLSNAKLKFNCGNYEISYLYNPTNGQIINKAKFKITRSTIPAENYT